MSPQMISFRQADLRDKLNKLREIPHGIYKVMFGLGLEGGRGAQIYFVGRPSIVLMASKQTNEVLTKEFVKFLKRKGFEFGSGISDPSPYKNIEGIDKDEAIIYVKDLVDLFLAEGFDSKVKEVQYGTNFGPDAKRGNVYFDL